MSFGERAALEGVLAEVKPNVAIEIGTAQGGSLERLATYADEVHSFDLVTPELEVAEASHVTIHTGDSHSLLPALLERLARQQRNVDFVLVDGDHSSDGVRRDLEDLFNSPAVGTSAILIHDTTNPTVRAGLDAIHFGAWPKVLHVDLDFVPGYMFREERLRHELWGGLGLVLVDSTRLAYQGNGVVQDRYYPAAELLARARAVTLKRETDSPQQETAGAPGGIAPAHERRLIDHIGELESEILRLTSVSAHHEALWRGLMESASWRVTEPLRLVAAMTEPLRRVAARRRGRDGDR
jgi:hypothetical protein